MSEKVNLDALIPREDFDADADPVHPIGLPVSTLSINELRKEAFTYTYLRKPDFQRETNEWEIGKVCDLVKSFLDGDLIPAIILWRDASSYTFVIDGSHRLSALAAWVNDDYGDGDISKQFYDGRIPDEQMEIGDKTRRQINKKIGPFKDYQLSQQHPDKVRQEIAQRARSLGVLAVQLQWVSGKLEKAEDSFFRINQQASPINQTELRILKARRKPHGIAARAIVRSGQGHKYWSGFSKDNQEKIQEFAKEIHEILFEPKMTQPIKTLDLPIGGKANAATSLSLILDFITIVNGITKDCLTKDGKEILDDPDGKQTVDFLANCRTIARRINSVHPSSLGLHPIVYFYSREGRHKIASFYALTALIIDLEKRRRFGDFIKARERFERLVIEYDDLTQQIVRKYRSAIASYEAIKDYYLSCISILIQGYSEDKTVSELLKGPDFKYLKLSSADGDKNIGQDFSKEVKSKAYIKEALNGVPKCKICHGYLHRNSITADHITRKSEGGLGTEDNIQLAHPYCNTTFKN